MARVIQLMVIVPLTVSVLFAVESASATPKFRYTSAALEVPSTTRAMPLPTRVLEAISALILAASLALVFCWVV